MNKEQISNNCLRGQPLPLELEKLWEVNEKGQLSDLGEFTLIDNMDDSFFSGYRVEDGVELEIVNAYQKMFGHIAFIAKGENSSLIGYWLGNKNRTVSESPIVELDSEGQFNLWGRNLAEYLLVECAESQYDIIHSLLADIGLNVKYASQKDLLKSLDNIDVEFDDPQRIMNFYCKGQEPPARAKYACGNLSIEEALPILEELGINAINQNSTKDDIVKTLGEPEKERGGTEVTILGYMNPWIKYFLPQCQIRFEFKDNKIVLVSFLEPDWGT